MLDTFLFAREKLLSSLLFQNVFLLLYTILLLLQFLMKPMRRVRFLRCFWTENVYRLSPFWSGTGYDFREKRRECNMNLFVLPILNEK